MDPIIQFICECNICHETFEAFFFGAVGEELPRCIFCGTKKRVSRSMKAFHEAITQLGGRIIGGYINANTPVNCICPQNHHCSPISNNIRKGQGMCPTCSGNNGLLASKEFVENITSLGGEVLGQYINCSTPVKCLCREGHQCSPQPGSIHAGQGMCKTCAGNDPKVAQAIFETNILRHGGRIVGSYKNNRTLVECVCIRGHQCLVYPHDARDDNDICNICYGEYAERNFHSDVSKYGGKIVGKFLGSGVPVECICKAGHQCSPIPRNVRRGQGICCKCIESAGEHMVSSALKILELKFDSQVRLPSIPKLRFDFSCFFDDRLCYIEFDGEQHFMFKKFFHDDENGFQQDRQRDLLKTWVCRISGAKLIRLDFTWTNKSIDDLTAYIRSALESSDIVVAEGDLYESWINDAPNEETIHKYGYP